MKQALDLSGWLTWSKDTFPVKRQFATSASGPWHEDMQSGDKWSRDKLYDGTFSAPYQFRGEDGRPGSDGDPKGYLKSIQITEITRDGVKSPLIQGARIEGAEIWGGKITGGKILSDSTIDVKTDAKIGQKLIIRADNFLNGVEFCHDDGTPVGEIYVNPVNGAMTISTKGDIYINGHKYSPYAVLA